MSVDCEQIQSLIKGFSLVRSCDQVQSGAIRLSTPFRYPDGSFIDVFLVQLADLFNRFQLTDYGQTTGQLLDMQVAPGGTKKRRQFIEDVCATLGVEQSGGEFRIEFDEKDLSTLPELIVRLGQACVRASDLALTQRFRNVSVFRDDLEEFIAGVEVPYESGVVLPGRFKKDVPIDFLIHGARAVSAVQTLSTANEQAGHRLANEVFRRWYDLRDHRAKHNFVTIFDTTTDIFRPDDLGRIGDLSAVLGFPAESDEIRTVLAA